jgi:hypothetical protein
VRGFLLLSVALALGCAQGSVTSGIIGDGPSSTDSGRAEGGVQSDGGPPDGTLPVDAAVDGAAPADGPQLDASGQTDGQKDGPLQADAQRDSAPQADGQKDSAPQADAQRDSGPQCTTQSLLVNGSFDVGPGSGWSAYSDWTSDPVIYPCGSLAHGCQAGGYAAWLGGGTSGQNYVYQTVAVPANTTSLRLTGYRWIDTAESGGVYDQMWIEIHLSSDLSLLETLATWSNQNSSSAWVSFSLPAAATHAGQTIDLLLDSWNDSTSVTSFYLDTLVLEAVVCQ